MEAHNKAHHLLIFLPSPSPIPFLSAPVSPPRLPVRKCQRRPSEPTPDLRSRHRGLPPAHTAAEMATAISASALLSSAFAGDRRHRRAARPAPRRAVPAGLTVRCEQCDKQKRQPLSALVPREQRFMFEGDELCGPVRAPTLISFSYSLVLQFKKRIVMPYDHFRFEIFKWFLSVSSICIISLSQTQMSLYNAHVVHMMIHKLPKLAADSLWWTRIQGNEIRI